MPLRVDPGRTRTLSNFRKQFLRREHRPDKMCGFVFVSIKIVLNSLGSFNFKVRLSFPLLEVTFHFLAWDLAFCANIAF